MRAAEFFPLVPELFERSKPAWEGAYNELIYSVERPMTRANVEDVVTWRDGGKLGALGPKELGLLNDTLARVRWPDVRSLAKLRGIEGMDLPRACALLHFYNPNFPAFEPGGKEGLAVLGKRVKRPAKLDQEGARSYRRYLGEVHALKEAIPYHDVPETHYFHVWLLEQALAELARSRMGKG
jgi:hypothetical protein